MLLLSITALRIAKAEGWERSMIVHDTLAWCRLVLWSTGKTWNPHCLSEAERAALPAHNSTHKQSEIFSPSSCLVTAVINLGTLTLARFCGCTGVESSLVSKIIEFVGDRTLISSLMGSDCQGLGQALMLWFPAQPLLPQTWKPFVHRSPTAMLASEHPWPLEA